MKTLALADADETPVPQLAFGTGTVVAGTDFSAYVLPALEAGFRHIDTAQFYQNETMVGEGIKAFLSSRPDVKRSDIFVTTKLSELGKGERVEESLQLALERLGLDYVDMYLIHSPYVTGEREGGIRDVWEEMIETKRKRLAKNIGVSNFNRKLIEEIMSGGREAPSMNQVSMLLQRVVCHR